MKNLFFVLSFSCIMACGAHAQTSGDDTHCVHPNDNKRQLAKALQSWKNKLDHGEKLAVPTVTLTKQIVLTPVLNEKRGRMERPIYNDNVTIHGCDVIAKITPVAPADTRVILQSGLTRSITNPGQANQINFSYHLDSAWLWFQDEKLNISISLHGSCTVSTIVEGAAKLGLKLAVVSPKSDTVCYPQENIKELILSTQDKVQDQDNAFDGQRGTAPQEQDADQVRKEVRSKGV